MEVNTGDTDSFFLRKVLLSIPLILKETLTSDRFNKSFSFSIDSPLQNSCWGFGILHLRGFHYMEWHVSSKSSSVYNF